MVGNEGGGGSPEPEPEPPAEREPGASSGEEPQFPWLSAAPQPPPPAEGGVYTDEHHAQFEEVGYLQLGQLIPADKLAALSDRLREVMLDQAPYPIPASMTFQVDEGGNYTRSHMKPYAGPTLDYRRIEGLDADPLVAAFMHDPLLAQIYSRYYGELAYGKKVVLMNKPVGKSTPLPVTNRPRHPLAVRPA